MHREIRISMVIKTYIRKQPNPFNIIYSSLNSHLLMGIIWKLDKKAQKSVI